MGKDDQEGRPKTAGAGANLPADDVEQSARFMDAAREAVVDETSDAFEIAFGEIAASHDPDRAAKATVAKGHAAHLRFGRKPRRKSG